MKKLILLAAMLAMALVAVAPAVAQERVQEIGQEADSGGVNTSFDVSSEGNFANQCAGSGAIQFGGTGNLQNGQGALQSDGSEADDIEAEGSSSAFGPSVSSECVQEVQQSAAASAAPKAVPAPPPAPKAVPAPPPAPKAAPAPPPAPKAAPTPPPPPAPKAAPAPPPPPPPAPKAEAKAEAKKEEKKELPKTGGSGSASLLGLGAGALLVGGGLLSRRIFR